MKLKKAFTLAEAILTMTILGIIAAVMVTTLKPNQYRTQGFSLLKKKVYAAVDEVTQTILTDCTKGMTLSQIYPSCKKTNTPRAFGTGENATYGLFMRGQTGVCPDTVKINDEGGTERTFTAASSLELKNGVCLYFQAGRIGVDVNGDEGPNSSDDRFVININNDGTSTNMPK